MKKRVLAILTAVLMMVVMAPAMAFAEDAADGNQEVSIVIVTDDMATIKMNLDDSNTGDTSVFAITPDTPLDLLGVVGETIHEAKVIKDGAILDLFVNGISGITCDEEQIFLGWKVFLAGGNEPEELNSDVLSSDELMDYVIPEIPADRYLMIVAQWEIESNDADVSGVPTFAVSANGGKLMIKDTMSGFNGSVDCYSGEFFSPEPVKNAVMFKIVSAEKAGAVLSGWTVYEADRVEIDSIKASVAKENGGLPPWGDPDLKHFLFDEYVESGVEMNTFIGLWSSKLIDTAMSTEDLYNLGGNDKSYYAVANWTTGTVQEMTVNGQAARLEIASDITAVDNNLRGKFETVEQIKEALIQEAVKSNENFIEESMQIEYMDIVLKVKNEDGVWEVATPENFPEEGIEVVIPYPAGINKEAFQFSVLHMFTHGSKAGSIETLEPELKEDGLHVVVHSLSPFAVAYQEMDASPAMGDTANMMPWIIMAVMAAAVGALAVRRRTN